MMIRRLCGRLAGWWRAQRIRRDALGIEARIVRAEARLEQRQANLRTLQRQLKALADTVAAEFGEISSEMAAVRSELEQLDKRRRQYEDEVEALRAQVRVAETVTIPGLVAANKLILERVDADTAVQVRRQVAQTP